MKRTFSTEQLVNRTFNDLTLREHYFKVAKDGRQRHFWKCECSCGKFVERREDYVHQGKAQSCGCKHPRNKQGWAKSQWKGIGEMNGQYFSTIRARCDKQGTEFTITIEEIWELFVAQGKVCALTGIPLGFNTQRAREKGHEQTASLDRINSDIGYVTGNIQWVHKDVNLMKNAFPLARFLEICRLVAALHPLPSPANLAA